MDQCDVIAGVIFGRGAVTTKVVGFFTERSTIGIELPHWCPSKFLFAFGARHPGEQRKGPTDEHVLRDF